MLCPPSNKKMLRNNLLALSMLRRCVCSAQRQSTLCRGVVDEKEFVSATPVAGYYMLGTDWFSHDRGARKLVVVYFTCCARQS